MVNFFRGDISESFRNRLLESPMVACDTETSGLNWRTEKMELCQFHSPETGTVIVQLGSARAVNLIKVMESPTVTKIFHHAPFDLAFMRSTWQLEPKNVVCTKIASKLAASDPCLTHSLQALLSRELGISLQKGAVRTSNWGAELSDEQIEYASDDVRFLIPLYQRLSAELQVAGLEDIYKKCCEFLPVRCELDQFFDGDIFSY